MKDISVSLKLLESNGAIQKMIKREMAKRLNKSFVGGFAGKLQQQISTAATEWLMESPELIAVAYGPLKGDFGIPKGKSTTEANAIIDAVLRTIHVEIIPFDNRLRGGLVIRIQPADFQNIFARIHPVVTEKGEPVDWIRWLLERGDDIVVAKYHVVPDSSGRSRSGDALMSQGGMFRVRPEYSGTLDDNAITRVFKGKGPELAKMIHSHFGS
jgi:hypothetical protein